MQRCGKINHSILSPRRDFVGRRQAGSNAGNCAYFHRYPWFVLGESLANRSERHVFWYGCRLRCSDGAWSVGYYVVYVGAGNHRACGYLSYAPFPAEKRGAGGIAAVGDRRRYRCGSPQF